MKSFHSKPKGTDSSDIYNGTISVIQSISRDDIIKGNYDRVDTTYRTIEDDIFEDQLDALADLFCQMFVEQEGD